MSVNWKHLLNHVIPMSCSNQRPFVCEGFPDESEWIIVGENPGNRLGVAWWSFWNDATGFDYNRFLEVYQEKGGNLKTGARARFNRIRCNGIKCVETNLYSDEGSDGGRNCISNHEVLEILLKNMSHLKGVIAHGKPACEWLKNLEVSDTIQRWPYRHFSRLSYKDDDSDIERICKKIKQT